MFEYQSSQFRWQREKGRHSRSWKSGDNLRRTGKYGLQEVHVGGSFVAPGCSNFTPQYRQGLGSRNASRVATGPPHLHLTTVSVPKCDGFYAILLYFVRCLNVSISLDRVSRPLQRVHKFDLGDMKSAPRPNAQPYSMPQDLPLTRLSCEHP